MERALGLNRSPEHMGLGFQQSARRSAIVAGLTGAVALACAAAAALLIWPVVARAVDAWSTDQSLSFGFLVVPVVLFLAWRRRASFGRGARAGLVVVILGLLGLVVAERVWASAPAAAAAGVFLWGLVVYTWGWRAGRALLGPLSLLTYALTLQTTLLAPLGFLLQHLTADAAAGAAQALGVELEQNGLMIQIGTSAFLVAEACSGMGSLLAMLGLTAVALHLIAAGPLRRLTLLIAVVPLALLANIARVTLVLLTADHFGQEAALGVFHSASSLVLFGIALAGLLVLTRMLSCRVSFAL